MGKGGQSQGNVAQCEENMAAWLLGVNNLKIQPFKLPSLGPNDVRVAIKAVGICGSDVHYLKSMSCGDYYVKEPMVIGHECAGIIEEVGSEVKSLAPGSRVALEPGIACWRCKPCKEGRYNLCDEMKFFATPPIHGSLANQIVHPADLCFKLPEGMSLEEGAMCEPLSVGVYACQRANASPKTSVLIMGAGPIGLVTMLAARAFGVSKIVVADVDEVRLKIAKRPWCHRDHQVLTKNGALKATSRGGKVCLVGMGHSDMTVPLTPAAGREVDIVGIFRYKNTWPLCIDFITSGKIDVKPLITHRFGFSQKEIEEAFATSARGAVPSKSWDGTGTIKIEEDDSNIGEVLVSFDLEKLYIPLMSAMTRFLGLPLPPFLKINVVPKLLHGIICQKSGKACSNNYPKSLVTISEVDKGGSSIQGQILVFDWGYLQSLSAAGGDGVNIGGGKGEAEKRKRGEVERRRQVPVGWGGNRLTLSTILLWILSLAFLPNVLPSSTPQPPSLLLKHISVTSTPLQIIIYRSLWAKKDLTE
ncbi:GroES-like zinc-binding alcohol dehydrogenase family protein [Actinidia rufa]|uniref:GroES-like zinc-binding alcohol dehydrogenase family protein n=1 Tax=Actinidia rufa TaxID=165716 RepID=A0A7J0E6A7_9ERIC|nr:GroES-like zinc-binding alcohol dehydrogenase family protein [Actinidia rufa]